MLEISNFLSAIGRISKSLTAPSPFSVMVNGMVNTRLVKPSRDQPASPRKFHFSSDNALLSGALLPLLCMYSHKSSRKFSNRHGFYFFHRRSIAAYQAVSSFVPALTLPLEGEPLKRFLTIVHPRIAL